MTSAARTIAPSIPPSFRPPAAFAPATCATWTATRCAVQNVLPVTACSTPTRPRRRDVRRPWRSGVDPERAATGFRARAFRSSVRGSTPAATTTIRGRVAVVESKLAYRLAAGSGDKLAVEATRARRLQASWAERSPSGRNPAGSFRRARRGSRAASRRAGSHRRPRLRNSLRRGSRRAFAPRSRSRRMPLRSESLRNRKTFLASESPSTGGTIDRAPVATTSRS
jgi:hypothetical protein